MHTALHTTPRALTCCIDAIITVFVHAYTALGCASSSNSCHRSTAQTVQLHNVLTTAAACMHAHTMHRFLHPEGRVGPPPKAPHLSHSMKSKSVPTIGHHPLPHASMFPPYELLQQHHHALRAGLYLQAQHQHMPPPMPIPMHSSGAATGYSSLHNSPMSWGLHPGAGGFRGPPGGTPGGRGSVPQNHMERHFGGEFDSGSSSGARSNSGARSASNAEYDEMAAMSSSVNDWGRSLLRDC